MANLPLEPRPGHLSVGTLSQAKKHKRKFDAVLTLEDPNCRPGDRLRFTSKPQPPHLVLTFEDTDSEEFGYATATQEQVQQALAFARTHAEGALLVHCFHGVGRSAAVALAILADRLGPGKEAVAVEELFTLRPPATPNLVVVAHADNLLCRHGALTSALAAFEAAMPSKLKARALRHKYAAQNPQLYAKRV